MRSLRVTDEGRIGSDRIIEQGIDIALWPQRKFLRARSLFSQAQLSSQIALVGPPVGLAVDIAEDRLSATLRLDRNYELGLPELALVIGDTLHNYRSALDALAWELARLEGTPDKKYERAVYFPICRDEAEWQKQVRGPLSSVPDDVLERLLSVQPFRFPQPDLAILRILHLADIADKHHGEVQASIGLRDASSLRTMTRYDSDPGPDEDDELEWLISGPTPAVAGLTLARVVFASAVSEMKADLVQPPSIDIRVGSVTEGAFPLLDMIDDQVRATFMTVLEGQIDPEDTALIEALLTSRP